MKKFTAIVAVMLLLLTSVLPVFAEQSVAVTPEIAMESYAKVLKSAKKPEGFPVYKGHFYLDFNQDSIPELVMAYNDGMSTDSCIVVYYCRLSFDFSNGLDNSTPVYTAMQVINDEAIDPLITRTYIGGSGGTDASIYRMENGKYGIGYASFGGGGSSLELYFYDGGEVFWPYYGNGEEVWFIRGDVPEEFAFYTMPDPNQPFRDVSKNDYFYEAVIWASQNNITSGTTATTFSPDATCTRGQVVTFLYRMSGSPKTNTNCLFTDVSSGSYYYDAVLWAVENGITAGTSATTFSPEATCTNGQILTFLHRAKGTPKPKNVVQYSGAYFAEAVAWAEENGLFAGTPGDFNPNADAKRADIVTYMFRDSFIKAEETETPAEHRFVDGRYEITISQDALLNSGGVESISPVLIEYAGLSVEQVENLAIGQTFSMSEIYEELPDITVESWEFVDGELIINGTYTFWHDTLRNRYIYIDYALDPNNSGLTYPVGTVPALPVAENVKILDYSTASERVFNSVSAFFDQVMFEQSFFGTMIVENGKVTELTIQYRP